MPKNEITNDDLAKMIKEGFDGVDNRFKKVDKRFDKIEGRLDVLEQGQEELKMKLGNVVYRFEYNELVKRLDALEKKVK